MLVANQWLQIDVGPPTLITGLVTKGRGDGRQNQWVVRYRLSYSNDSNVWYFYEDSTHPQVKASSIYVGIAILKTVLRESMLLSKFRFSFNEQLSMNS